MKCPNCGYDAENPLKNKPIGTDMAHYVDPATGKVDGLYPSKDDQITVKGKKLTRQDLFNQKAKEPAKIPVAPVVSTGKQTEAKPGITAPSGSPAAPKTPEKLPTT